MMTESNGHPTDADLTKMLESLSGIFAFCLYDVETDQFLMARDPIGVIPLYIGYDDDGKVYCASELKALEGQCDRYEPFLPGSYYWSREPGQHKYYHREWMEHPVTDASDHTPEGVSATPETEMSAAAEDP